MGNIIKQFREARGLTQEQLGELVGVKKAAVCKWEADDDVVPSPMIAIRLEEVSGGVLARWMTRPDLWEPPELSPFRSDDQDESASIAARSQESEKETVKVIEVAR